LTALITQARDRLLILPYLLRVFPQVDRELAVWRLAAGRIPDRQLRRQALQSIASKRFHCQGGSIYALYTPEYTRLLTQFIVALQTISDYLDNLSDRVCGCTEENLRQLHHAVLAAVDTEAPVCDWYEKYPHKNDGAYLDSLVACCRRCLEQLPGYRDVRSQLRFLMQRYADLQVFKHLDPAVRAERLVAWFESCRRHYPHVNWWEFSAACGSTLGAFMLAAMAAAGPVTPGDTLQLFACYYPWLCGLHILLDYFIDLDEDRQYNDLNFVDFYPTALAAERGLLYFLQQAKAAMEKLPRSSFHRLVTSGLLALYLSDPKAAAPERKEITQQLLHAAGAEALWLHRICLLLRKRRII